MKIRTEDALRFVALMLAALACGVEAQQFGPARVITERATMEMLAPSVEVPGTVIGRNDSRLASELEAKLVWIAEVGTEIRAGDTVARLENFTFKIREMETQSLVEREQANVTFLQSELKRLEQLSERNLSAKSQYDKTVAELAVAKSNYQIAQAQLGYAQIAMHITQIRAPFDGVVTERLTKPR